MFDEDRAARQHQPSMQAKLCEMDIVEMVRQLLWAVEPCDRGLCRAPATWMVDYGGTKRAPRCDEHVYDDGRSRSEVPGAAAIRAALDFVGEENAPR